MYTIYDSHVHIYPDKIARKAADAIGKFYSVDMHYDGSVGALLAEGTKAGISRFLVHSVATSAKQVESINNFIISQVAEHPDRFIGFATLHSEYVNPYDELKRAKNAGLMGVKLHPDFQKFDISDPVMDEAYAAMSELGMPVLFHMGDKRYTYSHPAHIPVILARHPGLKIICAHMGAYTQWDAAEEYLPHLNVYVDTSSSFFELSDERMKRLISKYGAERVLFGSDYPMWDAGDEVRNMLRLGLTEREYDRIFSGNLKELLGI